MRIIDFSSWHGLLLTIVGIAVITLVGVGIRLLTMLTFQQRRERMNRQINERLRTLIAAYKTLGGSFTGDLSVDPRHLRDLQRRGEVSAASDGDGEPQASRPLDLSAEGGLGSERARRIRDAVEAALSDIILLGTEEQVRLAARAASELIAGNPIHTHELVVSLRRFIREALDLDPLPADLALPMQGPARPARAGGGRGSASRDGQRGGGGGGGGMGAGGGMAVGGGLGLGLGAAGGADDPTAGEPRP